jgi:hypothetical protein
MNDISATFVCDGTPTHLPSSPILFRAGFTYVILLQVRLLTHKGKHSLHVL